MIRVGITGQNGFIGSHLLRHLNLSNDIEAINFERSFFYDAQKLDAFVNDCDVIVHLAAINRCENLNELYGTNVNLIHKLLESCERKQVFPHIIFSSSTQENNNSHYGKSKAQGHNLLKCFSEKHKSASTVFVIPNVFGEFCRPNYNSVVATFAHAFINGHTPSITKNNRVPFIYVASLCQMIIDKIKYVHNVQIKNYECINVKEDFMLQVYELLQLFKYFKDTYIAKGIIPQLKNKNEVNLFNTFRSYIDIKSHFPVLLEKHCDERGLFVETMKLGIGGQISFSTTKPCVTRGNHFHTRKIERFTVIRGKAKISLRKIGNNETIDFFIDGDNPAYIDMPVWFTHNISNVGDEDLYTQFWINEYYNPDDADTYYEKV